MEDVVFQNVIVTIIFWLHLQFFLTLDQILSAKCPLWNETGLYGPESNDIIPITLVF